MRVARPARVTGFQKYGIIVLGFLIVGYAFGLSKMNFAALLGSTSYTGTAVTLSAAKQIRPYAGDPEGCAVPKLDHDKARAYGCVEMHKVCFDQDKVLMFDLHPDADPPGVGWGWMPDLVPGYGDLMTEIGGAKVNVEFRAPGFRRNSSRDRPDLASSATNPVFSRCYLPMVWAPAWTHNYAEFYLNSVAGIYYMSQDLKIFDDNIYLVPLFNGYEWPKAFDYFLLPFSNKQPAPFHEVGSRFHMDDPSWPRCFDTVAFCGMHSMYNRRPPAKVNDSNGQMTYDFDPDWKMMKPTSAGQHIVNYWKSKGLLKEAAKNPKKLKVWVENRGTLDRKFLKLEEFIEDCNKWKPPPESGYESTDCAVKIFDSNTMSNWGELRSVDVLIGHHGAGLTNGFMMRPGSNIVEVRMHTFEGIWPDQYFKAVFRQESIVFFWQVSVTQKESWEPGPWEKSGKMAHRFAHRDRYTVLRWEKMEPLFKKIVDVKGDRDKYVELDRKDIRIEI